MAGSLDASPSSSSLADLRDARKLTAELQQDQHAERMEQIRLEAKRGIAVLKQRREREMDALRAERQNIQDSSFFFMLYRHLIRASETTAGYIYETALPCCGSPVYAGFKDQHAVSDQPRRFRQCFRVFRSVVFRQCL